MGISCAHPTAKIAQTNANNNHLREYSQTGIVGLLRESKLEFYADANSSWIVVRRWVAQLSANPPAGVHPSNIQLIQQVSGIDVDRIKGTIGTVNLEPLGEFQIHKENVGHSPVVWYENAARIDWRKPVTCRIVRVRT